jgi:hypothetical protein
MSFLVVVIYLTIAFITGLLVKIIIKYLDEKNCKVLTNRICSDLVKTVFLLVSFICSSVIICQLMGSFYNIIIVQMIMFLFQELHFLILIIALTLQLTTLFFLFFGEKIISGNKRGVKCVYRISTLFTSLFGTFYFCAKESGFCSKIPLYYYFLDDTAHQQKRDYVYSNIVVVNLVLILILQLAIQWQKRQLNHEDKLATITANSAKNRLRFVYSMMVWKQTNNKNLRKTTGLFHSLGKQDWIGRMT